MGMYSVLMKRLFLFIPALYFGCTLTAQVTGISIETFYTDDGTVSGYPVGHTTYRIYANCTNPTDLVTAVVGSDEAPLSLSVSGGVWNHPAGGVLGQNVNASLFGVIPALRYDSFVTIGRATNTDPGSSVYIVEDPAQLWSSQLFSAAPYGATSMILNTVVGGAWFGLPGDANAVAGASQKVLLAQITTNGSICGNFNLQVFPNWQGPGNPAIIQNGLTFGTAACGAPGCTDPTALNYDPSAGFNNGICLYACTLSMSELNVTPPTCADQSNGSIFFQGTGAQDFIAYSFNGASGGFAPDLYSDLGNGTYVLNIADTRFSNPLFNPGGIYGSCSVSETVVFDVQPLEFSALTPTAVSCGGGSDGCISAVVSGGTGSLSFSVLTCDNQVIQSGLAQPNFCGVSQGNFRISVTDANGCAASSNCQLVTAPPTLSLILGSSTPATCSNSPNGSQVVNWSGGTGDVDFSLTDDGVYEIEGGVSNAVLGNLLPGMYTVYAADENGCTASTPFTVNGPMPIVVNAASIAPTCTGDTDGSLSFSAVGGTGQISFSTDGTNFNPVLILSNLGAGVYSVQARDANNCTVSAQFTLSDPAPVSAQVSVADISCNGEEDGLITILASGGTGNYFFGINGVDFQSTGMFFGLAAGTYGAYVFDDNGCSFAQANAYTVIEPDVLTATALVTDVLCAGQSNGSVVIDVQGGTPDFMASVNGGAFAENLEFTLGEGNYNFILMDASGCTTSLQASVAQPAQLVILGLLPEPINETPGGSSGYTVSGGTPPYSYSWTDSDGNEVSNDQVLDGLSDPSQAGTYTITVTDANGCQATRVIIVTDIAEVWGGFHASLSPNPTIGQVILALDGLAGERFQYRITDTQGRLVMQKDLGNAGGSRTERIDVSGLAGGLYFVQITMGEVMHTLQLVKQ